MPTVPAGRASESRVEFRDLSDKKNEIFAPLGVDEISPTDVDT